MDASERSICYPAYLRWTFLGGAIAMGAAFGWTAASVQVDGVEVFLGIFLGGSGLLLGLWYALSGSVVLTSDRLERRRVGWTHGMFLHEIERIDPTGARLRVEGVGSRLSVSKGLPGFAELYESLVASAPEAARPAPLAFPLRLPLRPVEWAQLAGVALATCGLGVWELTQPDSDLTGLLGICGLALIVSVYAQETSVELTEEELRCNYLVRSRSYPLSELRAVELEQSVEDPSGSLRLTFEVDEEVVLLGSDFRVSLEQVQGLLQRRLDSSK